MIIVGIAGGTGSGKTTVARTLVSDLGQDRVALISQDSYYHDHSELPLDERARLNYDHPDAFDNALLFTHLQRLKDGEPIDVPSYDFVIHARSPKTSRLDPVPIVIVEGLMVLADSNLRKAFDIKVFVDTDSDVRVLRRLVRDMNERGRSVQSVLEQYLNTVKPMHDAFVEPSKRYADIIIPEGGHNRIAIGLLVSRLEQYLGQASR